MIIHQSDFSGNERQLKVLMKALREDNIHTWNSFVKRSGTGFKADLKGINLSDFNLREANLSNAELTGADFTGSDLRRANLSSARLTGACFHSTNLQNCKMKKASLKNSDFSKADLTNAVLTDSNIKDADFSSAILEGTDFSGTNIRDLNLKNVNLEKIKINKPIKIKVKTDKLEISEEDKNKSAWLVAQQDEEERRIQRLDTEKKLKEENDKNIRRKLGKKQDQWKKV